MNELSILAPILIIVTGSYLSIFPKVAGNSIDKVALYDIGCYAFALILSGYKYWGTAVDFNLILFETNWFWFTVITYAVFETPFLIWYIKRHNVSFNIKE